MAAEIIYLGERDEKRLPDFKGKTIGEIDLAKTQLEEVIARIVKDWITVNGITEVAVEVKTNISHGFGSTSKGLGDVYTLAISCHARLNLIYEIRMEGGDDG